MLHILLNSGPGPAWIQLSTIVGCHLVKTGQIVILYWAGVHEDLTLEI